MKFKFLFKSVYSLFEKENAVTLTTFPSGSDLYMFLQTFPLFDKVLIVFSMMELHSVFLFLLFGFLFWRP